MTSILSAINACLPSILTPVHPAVPYPILDLFGAMRLSSVVDWMARGVFDEPSPPATPSKEKSKKGGKTSVKKKERASALQECIGILVVVFGGETFLALCTGSTPSWLVNPSLALLFSLTHVIQTRTPLRRLLPAKPTLATELGLSLPDAIGRTLLLTRFSVLPVLHPTSLKTLPATPTTLLLVPFILAVPFASMIFSTFNFFSASPKLSTPAELQPGGWMMVDAWAPLVVPALFLSLIGPVDGWSFGMGLGEDEAVVLCMGVVWAIFAARAIYNLGYKKEQWLGLLGFGDKKIKVE
ncbi:hypothetical protein IAR55_005324 [Kwoniella newhampshirensis]|uniref:Uncharacterized protein n=1 Tax=Kwoniella newhampshirensis TaxID=1651941 RepID=A0AAW0YKL2_9TREE